MRILVTSLVTVSALTIPLAALAAESDGLVFAVEAVGHLPGDVPRVDADTADLSLGQMSPFVHEVGLTYGVGVSQLASDLLMRVGYRFAGADLPEGSLVGNEPATRCALSAVPITVAWRATVLPYRVRPLLGADLGGAVARLQYERDGVAAVSSGWTWRWEARAIAGVHVDAWPWLGARLFFEGRWTQSLWPEHGPGFSSTGIGFGLAVVATLARSELSRSSSESGDDDGLLKSYAPLDDSRLERAFALIRSADDAFKRRDFIAAEEQYGRALQLLPRDSETQRNVAAPVHVDRARALIEVGRSADARVELEAALAIVPDFPAAQELQDSLRGRDSSE